MNSENDLIQKLMISKKIMDKHTQIPRGNATDSMSFSAPMVETFDSPSVNYNIPQEFLSESQISKPVQSSLPIKDRIMTSKLPDEIKKLMLEHPIQQPNNSGPTLSNDLIESAARLMKMDKNGGVDTSKKQSNPTPTSNFNMNDIKSAIREVVEDVLKENGLLTESSTKSNETIKIQVGQHIFEGKISKIKKLKQ